MVQFWNICVFKKPVTSSYLCWDHWDWSRDVCRTRGSPPLCLPSQVKVGSGVCPESRTPRWSCRRDPPASQTCCGCATCSRGNLLSVRPSVRSASSEHCAAVAAIRRAAQAFFFSGCTVIFIDTNRTASEHCLIRTQKRPCIKSLLNHSSGLALRSIIVTSACISALMLPCDWLIRYLR